MYRLILMTLLIGLSANAQQNFFSRSDIEINNKHSLAIQANHAAYFSINEEALISYLSAAPYREVSDIRVSSFQILLPHPTGELKAYRVLKNRTLSAELSIAFPDIHTFDAIGIQDPNEKVKLDLTPQGFHAMIRGGKNGTIFIDPVDQTMYPNLVQTYYRKDFVTDKTMDCSFESFLVKKPKNDKDIPVKMYGSCELRTYRLALAATGEYTAFHGGTVAAAQAAQATTMNRVNGVYEMDMAITMVLVANNQNLIYTNSSTDPYANGNPGTMITQNQTNCDNVIGSANYDIGHVFGTNSGGLAGLGVVCSSNGKARGVTGSSAPIGDPFDIDYVCHEMGHQFAANHTQNNNCNRNNATAVEPGSASTIMGYAGICNPNIQSNSDDHFHGTSLLEISNFITSGGHTCPVTTTLSNSEPVISGSNANVSVPANTPFALTCFASDADNDILTYNWEQINNEISNQPPQANSISGPNFRSFSSTLDSTRYFPNLNDLANGGPFTWEVLPSVSRTMDFRVSVRDNAPNGGCADYLDVQISTVASAGPFVVNYPSVSGITWPGLSSQTVTWDVANTDQSPINAATVDIYLSTDGGSTYPTLILANTPNDGSQIITTPNLPTTTARIMVMNSAGTFFDISDNNFTITAATNDYSIAANPTSLNECQGTDAVYTIVSAAVGSYSDPITLSVPNVPGGGTATFSNNPINPGNSSTLTLSGVAVGVYSFDVVGTSTSGSKTIQLDLTITSGTPAAVTLVSPSNGATSVSNPVDLSWTSSGVGETFDVDVATDNGFSNIVDNATGLSTTNYTTSSLASDTEHFWRVRAVNGCAQSTYSSASFTTSNCMSIAATDVPLTIGTTAGSSVISTIAMSLSGGITDVNVLDVSGNHTYISDLTFTLADPNGNSVVLLSEICDNEDDFDLSFDDAATQTNFPCPPTTGQTYQPENPLSAFNNFNAQGNWTLTVSDAFAQDGGQLETWTLEVCVSSGPPCIFPTVPTFSGDTDICAGESATLSIASGNLNDATDWEWYAGSCGGTVVGNGTSITVSPTATTTYFARGVGGCVSNANCGSVTITENNVNVNVTQSGSNLTAQQGSASYQWLDCNDDFANIPGATTQTFSPTDLVGTYAVRVFFNGCADTSTCYTVDQAGISDDPDAMSVQMYPNPVQDQLTVEWDLAQEAMEVQLLDASGKEIGSLIQATDGRVTIDLSQYASALYFVRLTNSSITKTIKFVKE